MRAKKPRRHAEMLCTLVQVRNGQVSMGYLMAPTPQAVWNAVTNTEWLGTGHTKLTLQAQGWRVRRVRVETVAAVAP